MKKELIIKPDYSCVRTITTHAGARENLRQNQAEPEPYGGKVSKRTAREIKEKLQNTLFGLALAEGKANNLTSLPNYYFSFITLTLSKPQAHPDNYIKRHLLNPFLTAIKDKFNALFYFWKAEPQGNGNIHFHIITNAYIHANDIRRTWNTIQARHGYLPENWAGYSLHAFPATDVRGKKLSGRAIDYLVGYVTKKKDGRKLQGRVWGMSDNIRETPTIRFATSRREENRLLEHMDHFEEKIKVGPYVTLFNMKFSHFLENVFTYIRLEAEKTLENWGHTLRLLTKDYALEEMPDWTAIAEAAPKADTRPPEATVLIPYDPETGEILNWKDLNSLPRTIIDRMFETEAQPPNFYSNKSACQFKLFN